MVRMSDLVRGIVRETPPAERDSGGAGGVAGGAGLGGAGGASRVMPRTRSLMRTIRRLPPCP